MFHFAAVIPRASLTVFQNSRILRFLRELRELLELRVGRTSTLPSDSSNLFYRANTTFRPALAETTTAINHRAVVHIATVTRLSSLHMVP